MNRQKDLVSETFEENGFLAKKISGYKIRPQQLELSKKIQECITKNTPLIAEGPTGIGKSLAALVPAFERIKMTGEPVVVCTSSIILQSQYIEKDIPLLEELYDFQVNPVLIKGRNNYLCPKKLNDARNGKIGFATSDLVQSFHEVMQWAVTTQTGDKAELDFVPSHQVWSAFACVTDNECTSKQCPFYNVCPYYKERAKLQTAKLVVTNNQYLFSAITSNAEGMLPPKIKMLIMDEGHEVNAIARDFQERKYSMNSLKNQFDHFAKAYQKAAMSEIGESTFGLFEDMELDQVNGTLTDMFVGLGHEYKKVVNAHYQRDFWQLDIPNRKRLQKYVTAHMERLKFAVTAAGEYLKKFGFAYEEIPALTDIYGKESVEWLVSVAKTMDFLEQKFNLLSYYFNFVPEYDNPDDIFWMEQNNDLTSIHVKPTTGKGLTKGLFDDTTDYVPVVMSATLAANKSFDHVKEDLGIVDGTKAQELIVSSPFNLAENLLWYLPANCPAGNEPGHLNFALSEMRKVIEALHGKTLCLFTSRKNLIAAQEYFMRILPPTIRILSQEHTPKQQIINYMKANDNTVVLGSKSFFTGVDIQGPNLSAVLIDKFPFPMIGDPVNDTLMAQPRGFHKYSLPEAIIALKQGYGRLNRTATDKGIVACYEGRLSTANYKNKIFNSFDFKIQATQDWNMVLEYIKSMEVQK